MGVGIAIAAAAIAATLASDIAFSVEEEKKQKQLKSALAQAQSAINSANDFFENVYKVVKTRLEHLKQSMRKLPADVVDKLNEELKLKLDKPDKVMSDIQLVFGITQGALGLTGLVASGLTSAGLAAADGIVADVAAVAGAAGAALAVAGFGLTLYNGITALKKLNDAIDKVHAKRDKATDAMHKMKRSLDGLLKALGLTVGSYETLRDISNDWAQLADNFDKYSTAFYYAITGFAMGKTQDEVINFLKQRGAVSLKDDVLAFAKIIEENILQMMKEGKTDEQIINFYAKENPKEGLRFVMDSYFVSTLRSFLK
jgi:type II secretory pathway pseudopilin PulG